ncbi:MAG: hypothetical protein JJV93_02235 [Alphaproteobacteria bacterium]|nr:hypothetical protein [Alphaproteobacteria bacterium]MBL0718057.1 hypothetical protein [Alphaproteobacteria bacterium]
MRNYVLHILLIIFMIFSTRPVLASGDISRCSLSESNYYMLSSSLRLHYPNLSCTELLEKKQMAENSFKDSNSLQFGVLSLLINLIVESFSTIAIELWEVIKPLLVIILSFLLILEIYKKVGIGFMPIRLKNYLGIGGDESSIETVSQSIKSLKEPIFRFLIIFALILPFDPIFIMRTIFDPFIQLSLLLGNGIFESISDFWVREKLVQSSTITFSDNLYFSTETLRVIESYANYLTDLLYVQFHIHFNIAWIQLKELNIVNSLYSLIVGFCMTWISIRMYFFIITGVVRIGKNLILYPKIIIDFFRGGVSGLDGFIGDLKKTFLTFLVLPLATLIYISFLNIAGSSQQLWLISLEDDRLLEYLLSSSHITFISWCIVLIILYKFYSKLEEMIENFGGSVEGYKMSGNPLDSMSKFYMMGKSVYKNVSNSPKKKKS